MSKLNGWMDVEYNSTIVVWYCLLGN